VLRPKDENDHGREERIARLADPGNPRSWFGKSRSRVATGLSLTAPGIPMLFMGQEFLEDKQWTDDLDNHSELLLHWKGIDARDKAMLDHMRFIRELIRLRFDLPGLRGEGFRVTHIHNANRVLAFHRWVPDHGHDVLVIANLSNGHRYGYEIGFPTEGEWRERFNSDVYENWVNPIAAGNGGRVWAFGPPLHGFQHSSPMLVPANSILVFART
jgi:1,4-alpha-glucan branching enzyme